MAPFFISVSGKYFFHRFSGVFSAGKTARFFFIILINTHDERRMKMCAECRFFSATRRLPIAGLAVRLGNLFAGD